MVQTSYKVFNGKRYRLKSSSKTKSDAKWDAAAQRRKGNMARVVKHEGKYGVFVLYK